MNRLAAETSPYLLQHADNPVDWYPWGPEALERARSEDRPILLSVGYSACHWCHVMAHESFESTATAAVMNEHFVNVKVDREERPDVDALYMDATVSMTGQGGWPMTVFLTPAGEPFYAGTYFPPEPRHGMPSFTQLLLAVAEAWRAQRDDIVVQARRLVEAVGHSARIEPSSEPLTVTLLDEAERGIARTFDRANGGFGRAPKFPPASTLEFLLRRNSPEALEMVTKTLDAMAEGGMYDLVGGGFHRYSVDDRWLVPHFEKMLYDNALLAPAYLHAWVVTGESRYRVVVEETLDYVVRELRLPDGGLASAQDADTNGVEGLTFTWTEEEGVPAELLLPFEHGRSVIRGALPEELRARLHAERDLRPQPGLDDKVLASWNGLALAALAEAARRFERADWLDAARGVGEFLLGPLSRDDGRLSRSWREGKVSGEGFLDDYANAAHGLIELHVATGEVRWLLEAHRLGAARGRALRRCRERRLLPRSDGRGGARRAHEGPRRQPDSVGQLDARARAAAPRADLGRRRARAAGGVGAAARRADARPCARAPSAGCCVPSTSGLRRRGRSRLSGRSTVPSLGLRSRRSRRTRSSPSARRMACRCSRARASWTGDRRCTCASGSFVARR